MKAILDAWIYKKGTFEKLLHDSDGEFNGNQLIELSGLLGIRQKQQLQADRFQLELLRDTMR